MKAASRPMIEVSGVSKFYGTFQALNDVSFDVSDGEKLVIIGPSGSGKSTILRSINGLETIDRGRISVHGMDVSDPKADISKVREEVGMVFQSFNLFPHKSVLENLTLAQTSSAGEAKRTRRISPWSCCARSISPKRPMPIRPSSPAASSSASLSPALWP